MLGNRSQAWEAISVKCALKGIPEGFERGRGCMLREAAPWPRNSGAASIAISSRRPTGIDISPLYRRRGTRRGTAVTGISEE
jgi:hypothetical protein